MKTIAIVLPSIVLAFAVGFILTTEGVPSALFTAPAAQDAPSVGFLGHVEFVQKNAAGDTIGYFQSDNLVMERGKDCVAIQAFDTNNAQQGTICPGTFGEFRFIAIGDAVCTSCEDATADALTNEIGSRREDTNVAGFTAATGGTGTLVVINTEVPFNFGPANNTNNIFDAGLFDNTAAGNVFAIRNVTSASPNLGIDVNDGDTLDVTWTITVG